MIEKNAIFLRRSSNDRPVHTVLHSSQHAVVCGVEATLYIVLEVRVPAEKRSEELLCTIVTELQLPVCPTAPAMAIDSTAHIEAHVEAHDRPAVLDQA